jgi:ribonuclease HII
MTPYAWRDLPSRYVIGVDEAGRGCLAGRVYAAAVILNPDLDVASFVDSKKLSSKRREEIAQVIQRDHRVGIGFAEVEEIEKINILNASLLAMERAVLNLAIDMSKLEEMHILVDGSQAIKGLKHIKQTLLVKGDQRATPISAASIIAKVARDKEIREIAKEYPEYGFEKHKGYGTSEHLKAIQNFGPSRIHRKTFAGVKEYIAGLA